MPACNTATLGHDTFVSATEDVRDALFVMVGSDTVELALRKRCRFSFSGKDSEEHCLVGSPDSQYVAVVSTAKASKCNYLITIRTGDVIIFETTSAVTSLVWHPAKSGVFYILLANQNLEARSVEGGGPFLRPLLVAPVLSFIHSYFSRKSTNSQDLPPSQSQKCVMNDTDKLVTKVVDLAFIPTSTGLPLMMSLLTSGGDVFAVILRHELEPQPHAPDVRESNESVQHMLSWYSCTHATADPYLKLIISSHSQLPTDVPLQHMWNLDEVEGGRFTLAVMRADSSVGLYRVLEDDMISTEPNPERRPVHSKGPLTTVRFADYIPTEIVPVMRFYENTLVVTVGTLFAAVALLPIWLRKKNCWSYRSHRNHWRGSSCPSLSNDRTSYPAPLALCLPMRIVDHYITPSTNEILVMPAHSGGDPVILKLASIVGTALRGIHGGPVNFVHDTHALSDDGVAALAALEECLGEASGVFYHTDRNAATVYEDAAFGDCQVLLDTAVDVLHKVHSEIGNAKRANEMLHVALNKGATKDEKRVQDLTTKCTSICTRLQEGHMHRHGASSLTQVNQQLGEIHLALQRLERTVGSSNKEQMTTLYHEHKIQRSR